MSWGDAFKAAWNKATDVACDAAGALATGAKKAAGCVKEKASDVADWSKQKYTAIKDKVTETANWVKKKTDEVKEWTKKKASQAETWVKDKAIKFSKMAHKAYQNVKKKFGDIVAGATKIICQIVGAKKTCIEEKENNDKLAKATAAAMKKATGKEVDAMATEKSPFEGQPYMTSTNISKCKSLTYHLQQNGVLRRFNRYREALPYAYVAKNMSDLGDGDNETKPQKLKEKCLTMLPNSAKELNEALGLPKGTIKDEDLRDDETGFRAAIYRREPDGKFILVARDTQPNSLVDWKTNTDNGQGRGTDQYKAMRNLTGKLNDKGVKFDLAGYSKGGGLAQEGGLISTNSKVMVFNSAGLHEGSLARTGQTSFDSLASRTRSFSAEGDFLTYMNDTTDPSQQIANARFLRTELAGKGSGYNPMNIKYRNPAKKKAKDEAGWFGKDPDPSFAKAKTKYLKDIDDMIEKAEKKQKIGEKFILFPPVKSIHKETLPNSMGGMGSFFGAQNDEPNLGKLAQHQMGNVTDGLEKTIKQDKQTLQNFVKECG